MASPSAEGPPRDCTVADLKKRLRVLGLPINGLKLELLDRLRAATSADTASSGSLAAKLIAAEDDVREGRADFVTEDAMGGEARVGRRRVQPGTAVIGNVTSAKVRIPSTTR